MMSSSNGGFYKTGLSVYLAWSSLFGLSAAELKGVFAHYMVGSIEAEHVTQDVIDAKALGIDAFAMNLGTTTDDWAVENVQNLFDAANDNDFKLFFSFDMNWFTDPSDFIPLFLEYASDPAYYHHDGRPFTSTFYGGTANFGEDNPNDGWQIHFKDALEDQGVETYFVPAFSDATNASSDFFSSFPVVDGAMSWDTAWPAQESGLVNVSSEIDQEYLDGAHDVDKTFMMAISPVQFKRLDADQHWYLRGELTLPIRISQVLSLAPDFLEILTWNDAGESHNFAQAYPEALTDEIKAYTNGYNHVGWQNLLTPLIEAYKAGKSDISSLMPPDGKDVAGAFWYRTIFAGADCDGDEFGSPRGAANAEDLVNVAVVLAEDGATVSVMSGGDEIGSFEGVKGLNMFGVGGLQVGKQSVSITSGNGSVISSGEGEQEVVAEPEDICNFNYQVVGL